MNPWQEYVPTIIGLYGRANNMEETLAANKIYSKDLSPRQVVSKLEIAEKARSMYKKALRMCRLLQHIDPAKFKVELSQVTDKIEEGMQRLTYVIHVLDSRGKKWHIGSNEEELPTLPRLDLVDNNSAVDNPYNTLHKFDNSDPLPVDFNGLKEEVRDNLQALLNLVDFMEEPELRRIHKQINRLVNY